MNQFEFCLYRFIEANTFKGFNSWNPKRRHTAGRWRAPRTSRTSPVSPPKPGKGPSQYLMMGQDTTGDVPETKIGENTPPSLPLTILPRKRVDRKKEVRTFLVLQEFLAILLFLPKDHPLSHFQKSVALPTENAPSPAKVMGGGKFRISLPTLSFLPEKLRAHYPKHLALLFTFRENILNASVKVNGFLGAQHSLSLCQNKAPTIITSFLIISILLPLTIKIALMFICVNICWHVLMIVAICCNSSMGTI